MVVQLERRAATATRKLLVGVRQVSLWELGSVTYEAFCLSWPFCPPPPGSTKGHLEPLYPNSHEVFLTFRSLTRGQQTAMV